jgi:hypothetical protein
MGWGRQRSWLVGPFRAITWHLESIPNRCRSHSDGPPTGTSLWGRASSTTGCSFVHGEGGSGTRWGFGQSLSNLVGDMMGHGKWPRSANQASLGCC